MSNRGSITLGELQGSRGADDPGAENHDVSACHPEPRLEAEPPSGSGTAGAWQVSTRRSLLNPAGAASHRAFACGQRSSGSVGRLRKPGAAIAEADAWLAIPAESEGFASGEIVEAEFL